MKDFAIVYSSKTGNTKKVAEAMMSVRPDVFDIFDATENPDLSGYKLIVFGYGIDKAAPYASCHALMGTIENKMVALFHTLGALPASEHSLACAANSAMCLGKGNHVIGYYACQGAIDPKLIEAMRKMPAGSPHSATPENEARWAAAASHPDSEDIAKAKDFMERTLSLYERFYKMHNK